MPAPILGVDTGGTFTDLVLAGDGEERVHKLPSTPADPGQAVAEGARVLDALNARTRVVHGTTVGLNALLTGRVARAALVTNRGFADLIEIGRQTRPDIYDLSPQRPAPLVARELRFTVDERVWPAADDPTRLERIATASDEDLAKLVRRIRRAGPESIAVCLLHSYADPADERRVADALAPLGLPVTCSAELLPEHREFERFETALVNAALAPVVASYLERLAAALAPARLSLLSSRGGLLSAERAAAEPVRIVLSGPAGGVVGAVEAARDAGFARLVALDMGGTSTDVAFAATAPLAADEARASTDLPEVAGHPIGVPCLDLHTVGCGGGSIARVDGGGGLAVGPESAGADPGPVCYGKSDEPTVTDAHVQLGHVAGGRFLGGALELDRDAVARAFEDLGRRLGTDADRAAGAVLDAARAAMRRAVSVMTLERGQDPRRLPLVAFGGAGGLHAAALAASLQMPGALVPRHPGALSAWGMTRAVASADRAATVLESLERWPATRRRKQLRSLVADARAELAASGARGATDVELEVDLRYEGQAYELRLTDAARLTARFHDAHEQLYGYRLPERGVELVCLRVRVSIRGGRSEADTARPRRRPAPTAATIGQRRAWFGRWVRTPVLDRATLAPGHRIDGPALVEEFSGTTIVPPGWGALVVRGGHLSLEPAG
ncbi:hydantoinase/oxoprolinase family protein [Engelhardtia mirabilis]|uniref:Acetophenone carboxylase gamma subunit n=1 Tax=Engelhardtia mirabilis TaxID=2528011 RepID=A0A518BH82_9BACT|nr:Acetophenone carboxylase gamma subunit [Planctomycetes bacterium Pla133]QDV00640.1 Acetophenone carboxylase gamma subunit [Planctomycetes bacterium Pla86]